MELSPSWEASNCAATQELPSILWNPEIHYRVHKSPPLVLSWARSIESIPSHPIALRSILILSTHLRLGLPSGLLPSGFPTNILYAFRFSPVRATCPAHLILLDLIILIMLGSWRQSSYIYLSEKKATIENPTISINQNTRKNKHNQNTTPLNLIFNRKNSGSIKFDSNHNVTHIGKSKAIGLWDVEAPTSSRQSAHRWRWGCQPYAPSALYPQESSWYSFLLEAESTPGP
jgi:hypothetical protein